MDLADLLRRTGTGSIDELAELVDGDCDADIWIDEADGAVEIGAGTGAICLEYPFPIDDFWSTVDEVERDEIARWEAAECG